VTYHRSSSSNPSPRQVPTTHTATSFKFPFKFPSVHLLLIISILSSLPMPHTHTTLFSPQCHTQLSPQSTQFLSPHTTTILSPLSPSVYTTTQSSVHPVLTHYYYTFLCPSSPHTQLHSPQSTTTQSSVHRQHSPQSNVFTGKGTLYTDQAQPTETCPRYLRTTSSRAKYYRITAYCTARGGVLSVKPLVWVYSKIER